MQIIFIGRKVKHINYEIFNDWIFKHFDHFEDFEIYTSKNQFENDKEIKVYSNVMCGKKIKMREYKQVIYVNIDFFRE